MNVEIRPVSVKTLKGLIYKSFKGDTDLHRYHEDAGSAAHMARSAYNVIISNMRACAGRYEMKLFGVYNNSRPIGFTVVAYLPAPVLFSYGIATMHRTKKRLQAWIGAIDAELGCTSWDVGVNTFNTRALNFFKRNGFKVAFEDPEHNFISLCRG